MDFGGFVFDARAALVAVLLLNFFKLFDDDVAQLLLGSEDRFELGDVIANYRFNSFEISSMESFVRRCNCSSRMASACVVVKGFSGSTLGARPVVLMSIFLPPK